MDFFNWIEKNINDLKSDHLFNKYFDGIELEKGEESYYLTNPEKGLGLVTDLDFVVNTIHLFSGNTLDDKTFLGLIPYNLSFAMSQTSIRSIFGIPDRRGGGFIHLTSLIPIWDKYYFSNHSVHLQYSTSKESIDMITLASLKLEPYFDGNLH
jgi:hypothetical protein